MKKTMTWKNVPLLAALLTTSLPALSADGGTQPTSPTERIRLHEEAVEQLSKLTFFQDGMGMVLSPDFINMFDFYSKVTGSSGNDRTDKANKKGGIFDFANRWGVIDHDKEIKGFYNIPYKKMDIGVLGCIVCHSGKAAGVYYVGLGNKNIDVGQIANDAKLAQHLWKTATLLKPKSADYKKLEAGAIEFATRLADNRYNNVTQGMVPVSMIRTWFYRQVGKTLPANSPRSGVKVPHFWGYGEKRFIGQFSDGFGNGNHAGWGLAVELAGTQTVENVRKLIPKIEHAENLLHNILPPTYPFKIDQARAQQGKTLFDQTCAKCHGTYERDSGNLPIYKAPKHFAIEKIGTDEDRLNGNNDEFKHLVDTNPLNDYIQRTNLPPGYFAPRLEAVWARFPYLHNASIPSIEALLTKPEARPQFWSLSDAGEKYRFDENTLGLTLPASGSAEFKRLQNLANKGERHVYSTARVGHSSKGHWFSFSEKFTGEDKKNLIEYLKTL